MELEPVGPAVALAAARHLFFTVNATVRAAPRLPEASIGVTTARWSPAASLRLGRATIPDPPTPRLTVATLAIDGVGAEVAGLMTSAASFAPEIVEQLEPSAAQLSHWRV
jgi:hypothetical protein